MTNWGFKEHKFEKWTNWLLVIGTVIAIAYFYYHWDWLPVLLSIWVILTLLIHLIARFCHILEKRAYNNRRR